MKISKVLTIIALMCAITPAFAAKKKQKEEKPEGYKFEVVKENPITSIKNQASSGTCWAFSAISFFESEILRNGYTGDLDLSEMFVVSHAYQDRADKFVRLHGVMSFHAGSSFGNVLQVMKKYGAVPEVEMTGLNYGTDIHRHGEMDAVLRAYVDAIVSNPNRQLSTAWRNGFQGILDAYLGERPDNFVVAGNEYNPESYMESLGINLDDYVDLCSWTHEPFYEETIITVPDNWVWERAYNIPLDDLVAIIDNAIMNGYTVAWASDVSEKGFNRKGLGIVPDYDKLIEKQQEVGSDQARWIGAGPASRPEEIAFAAPCEELEITVEMRQEGYDNYTTTDDHGMHIFGIAKDQNGKKYYMVKNSWGEAGEYKGIWYVSEAFVRYKTMDIMVNRHAIPAEISEKINW